MNNMSKTDKLYTYRSLVSQKDTTNKFIISAIKLRSMRGISAAFLRPCKQLLPLTGTTSIVVQHRGPTISRVSRSYTAPSYYTQNLFHLQYVTKSQIIVYIANSVSVSSLLNLSRHSVWGRYSTTKSYSSITVTDSKWHRKLKNLSHIIVLYRTKTSLINLSSARYNCLPREEFSTIFTTMQTIIATYRYDLHCCTASSWSYHISG